MAEMGKDSTRGRVVKVKKPVKEFDEGQEIKREIVSGKPDVAKKEREMQESFDGQEIIKKPYLLMPTNLESDVKELQEGYEMKRQSFSSRAVGRRRSFCSSQAELANFLSFNGVKVVSVDMPPFMQIHAVDCARKTHDSLEKFTAKTLALTLKKEFDGVYGPAWHCIVGTSFGSFVTHSVGGFLYFSMDQKHYVLLFKTTVQKAS